MRHSLRTTLLFVATLFMGFAAFVSATIAVPHLREDMVEISVRPTLLSAVMLGLHFGTAAMVAFAGLILAEAIQSLRGNTIARIPLVLIAVLYLGFGIAAFVWTRNHHTLGYVLMGLLILGAVAIPEPA
jgi:hypothetical protein